MNTQMIKRSLTVVFLLTLSLITNAQKFEISYSKKAFKGSFSGSVILYLSKHNPNPKESILIMELPPVFRVEVSDLKPNQPVVFDDSSVSYPVSLSDIERGEYYVQAVFDRNLGGQFMQRSPGNLFSNPQKVMLDKDFDKLTTITCTEVIEEIPFPETERMKEIKLKSKLLSDFHGEDTYISGAVLLPEGYEESDKDYPVAFAVFGFSGHYKIHSGHEKYTFNDLDDEPVIVVYLDGNCKEGHSTYANSDINGPWGDALVKEFMPELSKRYRTNGAQFLYGHSSGGWAVLWLQVNYPEVFDGCWSSAPDQVDFRNWFGVNIYEDSSKFYDKKGAPLYDILLGGRYPITRAMDLHKMERVIDRGEQLNSFDAVYSTRDEKGEIRRLVDPENGLIDKVVANELFRRYDISYLLRNNWSYYDPLIADKIRISVGTADNFHLNHSIKLLEGEMKKLDADMEFEYFAGDHFTVFSKAYIAEGGAFLSDCYRRWKESKQ